MIGCHGRFEKVPFNVFRAEAVKCPAVQCLCEDDAQFTKRMRKVYTDLCLPVRATLGSAGYDFSAPFDFKINPDEEIVIPTGIRIVIPESAVLLCMPRSGSGFRYGVRLANTIGVIDSDYYNPETGSEGHILLKLMNHDHKDTIIFKAGEGIMQGIIVPYAVMPEYDNEQWECLGVKQRVGGFGSTDEQDGSVSDKGVIKGKKRFRFRRNK